MKRPEHRGLQWSFWWRGYILAKPHTMQWAEGLGWCIKSIEVLVDRRTAPLAEVRQ